MKVLRMEGVKVPNRISEKVEILVDGKMIFKGNCRNMTFDVPDNMEKMDIKLEKDVLIINYLQK